MAHAKTEIIIDGVSYPVIKELEFNYVIQYGNDKRVNGTTLKVIREWILENE